MMSILLASGTCHLPQVIGGLEINTHEMALELTRRGRSAAVLSKLSLKDAFGAVRWLGNQLRRRTISVDRDLGYPVYRSRRPWADMDGIPLPRSVVVQNGNMVEIGRAFGRLGVPSIAYLHGLAFEMGSRPWPVHSADLPFSAYIANSQYTAKRFRDRFGLAPHVIPPIFRAERYRCNGEGKYVTFINPVPEKGLDAALAIAERCPEIPFRFIKAWPLPGKDLIRMTAQARRLGNVEIIERQRDMLPVYFSTKVLLVPSQWPETWGRVVTEAQFSGIPVLASDIGGLPESVGPGGITLAPTADPEVWAGELRRLWHDEAHHRRLSDGALAHADRLDLDIDYQVGRFLSVVEGIA